LFLEVEKLEFKWKKLLGFRNMQENLKNNTFFNFCQLLWSVFCQKSKKQQTYFKNSLKPILEEFLEQTDLLTCFWIFLISNRLEQLEFILEKNIGI
jgi:hypothetical protein